MNRRRYIFVIIAGMTALAAQTGTGLVLDQLVQIGVANSSDIRIAENNLDVAIAERRSSNSGLIPRLSASVSRDLDPGEAYLNYQGILVDPPKYGSNFSVGQTLFDGGRALNQRKQGVLSVRLAEANLDQAINGAILGIMRAYYRYLSAVDLLAVAQEALDLGRRQLGLVEERYRLQAVRESDLLKARVNTGRREVEVFQAEKNVHDAATGLNLALSQTPGAILEVKRADIEIEPIIERTVAVQSMLQNNPRLQAQKIAVESAWLSARSARGNLLPSVSINYNESGSGVNLGKAFSETTPSTGLGISIPIFTGFQNSSGYIRYRKAALIEEERAEAFDRQLLGEVENVISTVESLHKILPVNEELLSSAEADVRLAEEQYRLGAIAILDLLDAQVSLISARSTIVRTKFDIKVAEAELQSLMGSIHK